MTKTHITSVTSADYPRLLAIWESAVKATHDFLTEEDFEYYKERMFTYFSQVSLYACRANDGEPAGFVGVAGTSIEMLFVDDAYRGLGIGRELLRFAIEHLRADRLDVNEQNGQAIGFYTHMGFKPMGRSAHDGEGKNYPLLHMQLSS